MLDIKFVRENKDIVAAGAKKKRIEVDLDKLLVLDDKRRALQAKIDEKRAEQNTASNAIAAAKSEEEKQKVIARMQEVKETLRLEEESMQEILKEWRTLMVMVPNVPDISVPEGDSDADNKEVRTWGEVPKFDFEPKSHTELLLMHDMADYERGAKVAGFRGYFLKNDGARLVWALERFVQEWFADKGFVPMIVPSLVRRESFVGTGYLPQSEEDLYKTQDGEYLAGTAEVATMGYYMDETLEKKDLPLKFFSFSPCFRREAGSHGKDTKGIFRIHEFQKYEQVILCEANHEESVRLHEEITTNAEELLQELQLPYRVVVNCGADLGLGQVKKYDIEAWMPSEKKYRETHSSSYFHDFQTRRLNIRYRDPDASVGAGGTLRYAHSLNNTALATPRILCQIVENNQRADGSITIPEALRSYMGKDVVSRNR
ncbi:serine--tRNA ligase [Candidatus Kaiserbacteria bacterium RIFCSPLOWO2_01_FULL_54_13]|uniref:Serine--tRNA ligase n=1 Tax=Candidatus Kaiserbacteria bacterium RIFCSPLOWO2_01_FULL_54_13 TaxID=1798512 RepID=A0A1F6F0A8_9BACT|nr:MAG: serine--tRNA ligase [Candidatus Kaiserbacteria bacterium RIFCSPLOWO2_01_FULL_54_13]